MRRAMVLFGVVAVGAGAVAIAPMMPKSVLDIVVGIVCGVAAAIPTSLLLLIVLTRSERHRLDEEERARQPSPYPPAIVIQSEPQWQVVAGEDLPVVVSRNGQLTKHASRQEALGYLSRPMLTDGRG